MFGLSSENLFRDFEFIGVLIELKSGVLRFFLRANDAINLLAEGALAIGELVIERRYLLIDMELVDVDTNVWGHLALFRD